MIRDILQPGPAQPSPINGGTRVGALHKSVYRRGQGRVELWMKGWIFCKLHQLGVRVMVCGTCLSFISPSQSA